MRKMKVLNIFPSCEYGGTEKVIAQSAEFLINSGEFEVGFCTVMGEKLEEFNALGVKTYLVNDFTKKSKVKKVIDSLYCYLIEFKPDIIHTHSLYSLVLMKILKSKKNLDLPIIHTGHGGPQKNYDLYASFLLKLTEKYVVISKESYEKLANKNDKVVLIENGIDPVSESEIYENKNQISKSNEIKLCYIGRLSKQKGVSVLLDAISILDGKNINVELDIIGNGELKGQLIQMVKDLHLHDKVRFSEANARPWELVKEIPIVVMPSLWEPGGIVAMEAIARNHTLIASSVGGLKELIRNGENGYLVSPNNSIELVNTLLDLYEKNLNYLSISREERDRYLFNYRTGKKLKKIYIEMISKVK